MSDPILSFPAPMRLTYCVAAGEARSRFLRSVQAGRLYGERCPRCAKVQMPPRGSCPTCAVPTPDPSPVSDTGTVTTFCVVNIPFQGQVLDPPYACAHVLLDGADTPLFHLIGGCDVSEVRMGLRVRAVWRPEEEREPSLEAIRWFAPTGEPDATYESYQEHL